MQPVLRYLSGYPRTGRTAAVIVAFIATVSLTVAALAYGSATNQEVWAIWAVLPPLVFTLIATPLIVSLHNEHLEAQGIYGMYTETPVGPPGQQRYWPAAMTPGSTSRQCILILGAAIAGSAFAGMLHYFGCPGDIETYHKVGAIGSMMLSIATGAHRW